MPLKPALTPDDVLLPVLTDLLTRHTDAAPGVVLEGLGAGPWLARLLAQLGPQPNWHLTVVGPEATPPPGLLPASAGHRAGWGAPHAVAQRNTAPPQARCLAVKLDEEARLHSLQDRGYVTLGPDEVAALLVGQCAAAAPNAPEKNLWQALGSGVPPVPLAGLLHLAAAIGTDPETDLRQLLPHLNLLPDAGLYERPADIGKRLVKNQQLLEYLVQQDPNDVDRAFEVVSAATAQGHPLAGALRAAYAAFLDLDPAAGPAFTAQLASLDYTLVMQLLRESGLPQPPAAPVPPPVSDPEPEPAPNPSPGSEPAPIGPSPSGPAEPPQPPYQPLPPRPRPVEQPRQRLGGNLDEAVFELSTDAQRADPDQPGYWLGEARRLWNSLTQQLQADQFNPARYELQGAYSQVSGSADDLPLALTQYFAGPQALGGLLPQPAAEAEAGAVAPELGPALPAGAEVRGLAWLHHVREELGRAAGLVPGFDPLPHLEAWWQARQQLAEHAVVLTLAPLCTLLADPALLAAARELTRAYEALFNHLYGHYPALRQEGAAETLSNYLLEPDLVELRPAGAGVRAALLSPLHPLVLWKYLVVADELIAGHGGELRPLLKQLNQQEVGILTGLPEPLRAVLIPADAAHPTPLAVAFVRRWGVWLHYLAAGPMPHEANGTVVLETSRKLAMLYPAVRQHLRLVVHQPDSVESLAPELEKLLPLGRHGEAAEADFQHVHLAIIHRPGEENRLDWRPLAALLEAGQVEPERVPAATLTDLAGWLRHHPAHVLVLPGQQRLEPLRVGRQPSHLHPLSLPHTLEYKAFLGRAFLVPRSQQRDEQGIPHPFGAYHDVASAVGRLLHEEISGTAQPQGHHGPSLSALLPNAVFVVAGTPATAPPEALPLAYPGTDSANLVLTAFGYRFSHSVDQLLRQFHFAPTAEQLEKLMRELVAIDRRGLFNTLSDSPSAVGGFYGKHQLGQLGVAVALRHYVQALAPDSRRVVVSLDSGLARGWLAHRPSTQRTDLLGLRYQADGRLCLDLIEVKASSSADDFINPDLAGEQLRAVAREVLPIVRQAGGNLLTDCRRELLRAQIFREGQLTKPADQTDADWTRWVSQLNQALDGKTSGEPQPDGPPGIQVNLLLVEVRFAQNVLFSQQPLGPLPAATHPADLLDLTSIRLGEPDIRRLLADLSPPAAPVAAGPGPVAGGPASSPPVPAAPAVLPASPAAAPVATAGLVPVVAPAPRPGSEPAVVPETEPAASSALLAPLVAAPAPGLVEGLAGSLYRALQAYGVTPAQPIDAAQADVGPSIIRLKLLTRPGQRLADLHKLTNDVAREMQLHSPPLIRNLPGTRFVAVDVPRQNPVPVPLAAALARVPPGLAAVSFPVGLTPGGDICWLDLPHLPHMLVGGTSGSGKTIFLYSLITALAYLNPPELLQLVLVDPKRTDFQFFEKLPHVRGGRVLEDAPEAVAMLQELLEIELPRRTELLKTHKCRDIHAYRREARAEPLPFLVVVIDEFADLIQSIDNRAERKAFEQGIGRLAQRTRSVGIHLVIATQRPDTTVIFGNLKTNLDCRVALRLASNTDSRVVLDEPGAEDLIGNGDMLVRTQGQTQRLQGFYLGTPEIQALLFEK